MVTLIMFLVVAFIVHTNRMLVSWYKKPLVMYCWGGMVKTATGQNGDKPKRLQLQSKHINLLSSTMDLLVYF